MSHLPLFGVVVQAHLLNTVIAASQSTNPCPSNEEDSKRIELPIVQLYGVFETRGHFALELELMQSIDLSEKLQLGEFSEEQVSWELGVKGIVSACLH